MNRRVLLVDDHAELLGAVRQLLGGRYEVRTASSGAQALSVCQAHGPFAVVVSDYAMPGMTGIELLAELAERWPDTVRVLLTGCADLALAQEALEHGALFRYLTKPVIPAQVLSAVAAGVERFHTVERERLLTEQLAFARESLRALVQTLDGRLARTLDRLDALATSAECLAGARSTEEVLERTEAAVRELLGTGAPAVRLAHAGSSALELVPEGPLDPDERRALTVLAASARSALAGLEPRSCGREVQEATLAALTRIARERDDETGEHLERMSAYVRLLARALRAAGLHAEVLTDAHVADLARAAPLHDIGKVAIPDAILFKPGKLDEREWEVMRTHTTVGAEILRSVRSGEDRPLLDLAREIAWTHHERWDGTGYPRRLAGAEIPLAGRIVALVDCYDALTSVRPYKPAWSHADAVAEIAEQRGRAYDPEIVAVFVERQREFEALAARARAAVA